MAAAGATFSIREYAALARARAGGGGSWPFGGEAGPLPPLEVRRFRWWADEAAALEEEEGEVERRMAAKRRKRSVAELFAAVPRVARGQGCSRGKAAAKRKPDAEVNGKGKVALSAAGVKATKGATATKKKKKKVPAGIDVRGKEKNNGVKGASISVTPLFHHSMIKMKLTKSLNKKKRNQEVSVLLDKKSKGNRKSVSDTHKKATGNSIQAQSIHKKTKRQSKAEGTILDNTGVRCKPNSSCKSKHVTFSNGTDRFGSTVRLPEDNTEQCQSVQTSLRPTKVGHGHHNTDEPQSANQRADAMSGAVERSSFLSENVVAPALHTVPLTKAKERSIPANPVDLNHCIEISNNNNCLNSINLACLSSKLPSQNFNGLNSPLVSHEDLSLDVECLGEENHMIPQGGSLAVKAISSARSPSSQPSSSCLNDQSRDTLQERLVANGRLGKVRQHLRSGKGVVGSTVNSISSSTGSNKSVDARAMGCISARRNIYLGDDCVGLPLNSRGEFIKVHPAGAPNSIDIFKRQCLGQNSLRPSAFPTLFTPGTCADHVNRRPNHHPPKIYTVDQSVFHPNPRLTLTVPTAYGMDFRQLPSSERMTSLKYIIPSNKYQCTNQRDLSGRCYCSGCMRHHNPQQKLLGLQNCCLSQNFEQNTQHTAETTMRLMGKTVTLGTGAIQYAGLNNEGPCSSKQTRAEDQSFQGAYTKVFPQLFNGGLIEPPAAIRISERQPSGNPAYFSFVPAAELRSGLDTNSFRTNADNQQPELAAANNLGWSNEGYQQPVMANQMQSNSEDMLQGSMHFRHTSSVAPVSSFDRRNSVRNFIDKGPALYDSSHLTQQFGNMTQRNSESSHLSGYGVQSMPGLTTTQTKFTSLRPLPPSVIPSHVHIDDYAQPHGCTTAFHSSIHVPYPASNSNAPGSTTAFDDDSMRWTMMRSKPEGLEQIGRSCKRPVEKDDVFLTLPKRPCIAQKGLNLLPFPERDLGLCGSTPDAQPLDVPVAFSNQPEPDLRLGREEERHATLLDPVTAVRPVKLKPGAKHVLQPSASATSMRLGNPWPVHSVAPFAGETGARTVSGICNPGPANHQSGDLMPSST